MTKKFKPMLAPNEIVDLEELSYPLLASFKLDGIRCIFYKGEILSRSLKQIQNKQLREKFEPLRKYSEDNDIILDGEIYSPDLTFQEITRYVMTQDFEDKKSVKKFGKVMEIPSHLKFYCFDCIENKKFELKFRDRVEFTRLVMFRFPNIAFPVEHILVKNNSDVQEFFKEALTDGFEGLILRALDGKYKCGRGTIKEGLIFKVKPYPTFDGKILDVIQATKVDPNAEKKINELGRSVTSKKKGDRILIEKAAAFLVKYGAEDIYPVIAMTDIEKEEIWKHKEDYIGKTIEYKGMLVGSKDVPRHPIVLRFIEPNSK